MKASTESLHAAKAIQTKASALGFDWPDISGVMEKIHEEIAEIQEALNEEDHEHAKKELGDLLFAVVNASRFLDADPVQELAAASERFTQRFDLLQFKLRAADKGITDCTIDELDLLWESVKKELVMSRKNGLT